MLETGPCEPLGARCRVKGGGLFGQLPLSSWNCPWPSRSSCRSPNQDFNGVSEPWPPPGTSILVQVLP
ncbi:hypothetical protein B0G69_2767 [Paraburkholderia sp. RAU2J]|nr:hypothetical protein B0G69_2767 [Paraburkholderia sp. RAU2J]